MTEKRFQDTQDQAASDRTEECSEVHPQHEVKSPKTLKKTRAPKNRVGGESTHCIDIAHVGGQGFVELSDGTYHGIGEGVVQVSEAELQRQLREKGIAELSQKRIAELRVFGMVSPADTE